MSSTISYYFYTCLLCESFALLPAARSFEGHLKGGVIAVGLGNGCAEAIFFSYISIIIIQMKFGLFFFFLLFYILNWLYLLKTALL